MLDPGDIVTFGQYPTSVTPCGLLTPDPCTDIGNFGTTTLTVFTVLEQSLTTINVLTPQNIIFFEHDPLVREGWEVSTTDFDCCCVEIYDRFILTGSDDVNADPEAENCTPPAPQEVASDSVDRATNDYFLNVEFPVTP